MPPSHPPPGLHGEVVRVLGVDELSYAPVSGGCIAHTARVADAAGPRAFLKWSAAGDPAADTYPSEADGLAALAASGAVRVPRVLAHLESDDAAGLLLEWLPPAPAEADAWGRFARRLAEFHRPRADAAPGWSTDNHIGPLPQPNAAADGWGAFWWQRRLLPQILRAGDRLGPLGPRLPALEEGMPDLLDSAASEDGLSLLHGDLWSGNVHFTFASAGASGGRGGVERGGSDPAVEAALIDPAVFMGHREVDLAMADLFGGFPRPFWAAYRASAPPAPGADARRPAYQLYYLLVHVNLFGSSYLAGTRRAVAAVEEMLGR